MTGAGSDKSIKGVGGICNMKQRIKKKKRRRYQIKNATKSIFEICYTMWKRGYADRHERWQLLYRRV